MELVLRFLGLISNCVLLRRWNPGPGEDDLSFPFPFCMKDLWRCIAADAGDDRCLAFGENFLEDCNDSGGDISNCVLLRRWNPCPGEEDDLSFPFPF